MEPIKNKLIKGQIKTIWGFEDKDWSLYPLFFEEKEDAEQYKKECDDAETNWLITLVEVDLMPASTYDICLEEFCETPSDGYFFCGKCMTRRQGSS